MVHSKGARAGLRWGGLALAAALFFLPGGAARAQGVDNKGTEFYFAFLPQIGGSTLELHLTADLATDVTVEYPPGNPIPTSPVSLTPGQIEIVPINGAAGNWTLDAVSLNTVHATAANEFVAYMVNRGGATSDAALALPVDALNNEYLVMDYDARFIGAEFAVFAVDDGTVVDITPTANLVGPDNVTVTRPAGQTFQVALDRGEGYVGRAPINGDTLTGTEIRANRRIGVTNGNGCTHVPNDFVACDHIFEVAQPVQSWSTVIPVANLPLRTRGGTIYRVLAAENDTTVQLDGVEIAQLDRGEFYETPFDAETTVALLGDHVFSADKPIFVSQYMTGTGFETGNLGDPAQGNMIPADQFLTRYTFARVGGAQFARNFLTVIAHDIDVGAVQLDGSPIPAESFTAIPESGFSVARVELLDEDPDKTFATASPERPESAPTPSGHGITVEGYNGADSYIYPGGASFDAIPRGDFNPPICEFSVETLSPLVFAGNATDDRPSEDTNDNGELDPGEDLNDNGVIDEDTGILSVTLDADSVNAVLALDPGFVPLDPSAAFTVREIEIGGGLVANVRVRDGAGNECTGMLSDEGVPPAEPEVWNVEGWGEAFDLLTLFVDDAPRRIGFFAAQAAGVQILDVTDPAAIQLIATYDPDSCPADGSQVAFFADDVRFLPGQQVIHVAAGPCGVHVVDVGDVTSAGFEPTLVSSYSTPTWAEGIEIHPGGGPGAGACGSDTTATAYVADFDSLRIFDVSDPADPIACGFIDTSDEALGDGPVVAVDVVEVEGGLFAAVATGDGARGVDVGDAAAPFVFTGWINTKIGEFSTSQDISVDLGFERVYLPRWAAGLEVLRNVGDGDVQLGLESFLPTDSAYFTATRCGARVCATEGQDGLRVFDLVEGQLVPAASDPIAVGPEGAWAWDLLVDGCTAYVTFGILGDPNTGGLQIGQVQGCQAAVLLAGGSDGDGDGIADDDDNCAADANPSQTDSDADGFGNACDADYDNDGQVAASDFLRISQAYGSIAGEPAFDAELDCDDDGRVAASDFLFLSQSIGGAPGPSGLACAGSAPCP